MIEAAAEVLQSLSSAGLSEREVFIKHGRSRRLALSAGRLTTHTAEEAGWAVRAGTPRGAFFFAASGEPVTVAWPEPDGRPVDLPPPAAGSTWSPPPELEAPLLVEGEARGLIQTVASSLAEDLPGARLIEAVLEDGVSRSRIANHKGLTAESRQRVAGLRLSAVSRGGGSVHLLLVARAARRFPAQRLGRELATRLSLARDGRPVERDRGELLLAPALGARLIAALQPLWCGIGARRLAKSLTGRDGHLAAPEFDLIESLRRHDAPLQAGWDGEGLPTGPTTVVEDGRYNRPVVGRLSAQPPRLPAVHCCRRAGWRDRPTWGLAQLLVRPRPRRTAAELVGGIERGYYLMDVGRPARVDFDSGRFRVPVCGWSLEGGRARDPIAGSSLSGRVTALLRGIRAVAGDLDYVPLGPTVYGCPSLLVTGVELVRGP